MAILLRWPVENTLAAATSGASPQEELQGESANEQLLLAARQSTDELLARLNASADGLSALQSELRLAKVGPNLSNKGHPPQRNPSPGR